MEEKAIKKLTYGVFLLSTKLGHEMDGCIVDTCIQIAKEPERVAVAIENRHYTCELLNHAEGFCISIMDETCSLDTIALFGYRTGRETNKFGKIAYETDAKGIPYLTYETCGMLSCHIVDKKDLGSHTLFIGEVVEDKVLSQKLPLTYAEYQKRLGK